jgi:alkanesulfonate monooxygenase SsuD/methylene tetrahydromethanopterin reductase-like flavin-dependent oxidoreductase (luciferase family)
MKFGVLFMPADPPAGANIGERWREVLEAGEVAEEYGFDGFFLPEHHFQASSFNSSPLVALAVLAGRTKRLRVGTSVLLLPCYHPLKLAEDTAQLDARGVRAVRCSARGAGVALRRDAGDSAPGVDRRRN